MSEKVICLVYVDDTPFYAKHAEDIDEVKAGLRKAHMGLEEESDVAGFLGVHIKNSSNGTIDNNRLSITVFN